MKRIDKRLSEAIARRDGKALAEGIAIPPTQNLLSMCAPKAFIGSFFNKGLSE